MSRSTCTTNAAGPHRPTPPCPPIDPSLVYPVRRLLDWGIGARGLASLKRAGMPILMFSKWRFFRGSDLIAAIERSTTTSRPAESNGEKPRNAAAPVNGH
jgi:hypothetical protein